MLHNNESQPDDYDYNLKKNEQKVKLKNAIMQVWSGIKKETQPKNMKQILKESKERMRQKQERLGLTEDVQEQEKTEEQVLQDDSKTSYFSVDQYHKLSKRINEAHYRMKEQQAVIDKLEKSTSGMINEIKNKQQSRQKY